MRARSRRKERQDRKRRALVTDVLGERPWCEARIPLVCDGRSVDVHERARQSQGGDYLDESLVLAVCRACHEWIGRHPTAAEEAGLAEWGWAYRMRRAES